MPDETIDALKRVAAGLEQVTTLMNQAAGERRALAETLANRPDRFKHDDHEKRMEVIRRDAEKRYAAELEFRTALLKAMADQADILRRIEALLTRPT